MDTLEHILNSRSAKKNDRLRRYSREAFFNFYCVEMCRSLHFCRYVVRKYFRTFVVPRVRRTTTDSDRITVQRTLRVHVPSKISYLQYVYLCYFRPEATL